MVESKRPTEDEMSDALRAQKTALNSRLDELFRWSEPDRVAFKKVLVEMVMLRIRKFLML